MVDLVSGPPEQTPPRATQSWRQHDFRPRLRSRTFHPPRPSPIHPWPILLAHFVSARVAAAAFTPSLRVACSNVLLICALVVFSARPRGAGPRRSPQADIIGFVAPRRGPPPPKPCAAYPVSWLRTRGKEVARMSLMAGRKFDQPVFRPKMGAQSLVLDDIPRLRCSPRCSDIGFAAKIGVGKHNIRALEGPLSG